jgi:hypothetical protein
MDNKAFYFPWVRKGLGGYINEKETLNGDTKGRPELTIRTDYMVQHNQQTVEEGEDTATEMFLEKTVKFVGPGDILRVNPSAIMKVHPDEGSDSFAIQRIPYVEFWEPDFLWRYTPATHDSNKLRPWLALIACRKEDIKLMTDSEGAEFFTFIGDGDAWKQTFPALEDLILTAHAQGSAEDRPEFCRLLGLRNGDSPLVKDTEYIALLIPSYETGRRRGLGFGEKDIQDIIAQLPAWEQTLDMQKERPRGTEFPVYYKWSFKTKEETFDDLAKALSPCSVSKSGIRLDVTDMGEGFSYNTIEHRGNRNAITMPAATVTSDFPKQSAFPAKSGGSDEKLLYKNLEALMEENPVFAENRADRKGDYTLQEDGDDPVVAPPVYGARHAMTTSLDDPTNPKPWLREVNMDIHHRAAAGLGRKVVQKHQEELMDRAWKQVEAVQALNMELYKRLLSIRTNQALQRKTVDGFDDSAQYVAYMMRYLSSMKDAGAGKYTLSDIIKNADIPASFAAPSFQNNVEKLSHIVSGLDPTSLMERIVKDQLFKFTSPDPAGSLNPDQLKQWCKRSREALIYHSYKKYWNGYYDISVDGKDELQFSSREWKYGPSKTGKKDDGGYDIMAFGKDDEALSPLDFLDLAISNHRNDTPEHIMHLFNHRADYAENLRESFAEFDPEAIKPLKTRVFVLPDEDFIRFRQGKLPLYESGDGSLSTDPHHSTKIPISFYALPNQQFDSFFDKTAYIVEPDPENAGSGFSFFKPRLRDSDVSFVYNSCIRGSCSYQDLVLSEDQTVSWRTVLGVNADEESRLLYDYLQHFYRYGHFGTTFSEAVASFVRVFKQITPQYYVREAVDQLDYSSYVPQKWATFDEDRKRDVQVLARKWERYYDLIRFFNAKDPTGYPVYNNRTDGSFLGITVQLLRYLWSNPALLKNFCEHLMGGHPTILTLLCSSKPSYGLPLLIAGAHGSYSFKKIKPVIKRLEEALSNPSYIVIAQRFVDKHSMTYSEKGLRALIKKATPAIDALEKAIPLTDKLNEIVLSMKKASVNDTKKAIDEEAVDGLQESIVKQSSDEEAAYARIRRVAGMYYNLFFSDTKEGEMLREDYLDKLLMSKYPILAYPFFPEPTYYYLKMLSDKFIIPGLDEIEPETVAMFVNNPQFTEAFLCGMNTEMGTELQWREYPTDRRGSYFRKFWDSDSSIEAITGDKFFDVVPLHLWDNALGKNHLGEKGDLLIFAIRSKLLRLYPSTRIYLNKAKMKTGSSTQVEFADGRKDPVMETFIREDLLLIGFDISLSEALGNPKSDNHGYMLTFEQDVDDLEFQYDNKNWRRSISSDSAGNLIDTPSKFGKHVSLFVRVKE